MAWAPLPRMATWFDEQFTLMSFASVVVLGAILRKLGRRPHLIGRGEEGRSPGNAPQSDAR